MNRDVISLRECAGSAASLVVLYTMYSIRNFHINVQLHALNGRIRFELPQEKKALYGANTKRFDLDIG